MLIYIWNDFLGVKHIRIMVMTVNEKDMCYLPFSLLLCDCDVGSCYTTHDMEIFVC